MARVLGIALGPAGRPGPLRRPDALSRWTVRILALGVAALSGLAIGRGVSVALVIGAILVAASLVAAVRRLDALLLAALVAFLLPNARFGATSMLLNLRWALDLVLLVVLFVRAVAVQRQKTTSNRPPVGLIGLLIVAVTSVGWSVAPGLSFGRAATFLLLVISILLVRVISGNSAEVQSAFKALAALMAVVNLAGFAISGAGGRYAGIFSNPNAMGVATALLLPVALQEAFVGRSSHRRIAFALVAGVLAAEAAAAGSRGGLLAAAAAYLIIGLSHVRPSRDVRRLVLFLLPVTLAVVGAYTVADAHRLSTQNSRADLWKLFPGLFDRHPLIGTGFGTTQVVLAPLSDETGYYDPHGVDFHNSYLNLMIDLGVVGAVCFAALLATAWTRRHHAEGAMAAIVVAGLVSAIFESWMLSVGSGFAFVFWFALIDVAIAGPKVPEPAVVPGEITQA